MKEVRHAQKTSLCLDVFFASDPDFGVVQRGSDKDALNGCLKNWGQHPFVEGNLDHRTIAPSVRVFGIGVSVQDDRETEHPELVLIKPSVSVFSEVTLAHFGHRDQCDRSIVITPIGGS
jgi:hypothetical protein